VAAACRGSSSPTSTTRASDRTRSRDSRDLTALAARWGVPKHPD
jgi:hypothetical protein